MQQYLITAPSMAVIGDENVGCAPAFLYWKGARDAAATAFQPDRPTTRPAPDRRSATPPERGKRYPSRNRTRPTDPTSPASGDGCPHKSMAHVPPACRPAVMPEYRAYSVGDDGRFTGFEPLVCADDAEAIKKDRVLSQRHGVELWSGPKADRLDPQTVGQSRHL